MAQRPSKRDFLHTARAWNERARLVEAESFVQSDFFDPRDKVQVKYEMLRAHQVDRVSITEASRRHGYSRESFYAAAEAFKARGVLGLVDEKRGPRHPRKLTQDVQEFILAEIRSDPSVSTADLVERVGRELGVRLHRRSVERFRGARKKNNDPTRAWNQLPVGV